MQTILTIAHSVYRTIRFPHHKDNANIFEINYVIVIPWVVRLYVEIIHEL